MAAFDTVVFDPDYDFNGVTLVEASAGTGKTYQIQNVYLRLVLVEGLPIEKILVVTFTEAATRELRERMRAILVKCNAYLDGRLEQDDGDRVRLEQVAGMPLNNNGAADEAAARRMRIKLALMNFDNAAIFTIHGFCNRVLQRYAFECGHDPDAELLENDSEIMGDICRNWWRKHRYAVAGEESAALFESVGELQHLLGSLIKKPDAHPLPERKDDGGNFAALACRTTGVLGDYLKVRQAGGRLAWLKPKTKKKIEDLITDLHDLLQETGCGMDEIVCAARGILDLSDEATWLGKSKDVLEMRDFAPEVPDSLVALVNYYLAGKARVIADLKEQILAAIRNRQMLTYDGMLRNVREALRDEQLAPELLRVLREEFSAALIDEFQDTDPVQYEIFDRIFSNGAPLVFVGDPKQAIYGFRSGDIYTYYHAKQQIAPERIHRLPKNYRSDAALIAAINEFFSDTSGSSFMNKHIQYEDVAAAGLDKKKVLQIESADVRQPLRVWRYNVAGSVARDGPFAAHVYARVAEEITRLLNDESVTLGGRRLKPSDFAVLVTVHAEADAIHAELLKRGVNAVKQKAGRVFETEEAQAMLYLMQAMLAPNNPTLVRTALSCDVMPCTEQALKAYCQDVAVKSEKGGRSLEDWMALMDAAGGLWKRHSFIEAFGWLEKNAGLRAHIAGLDDGERRLTNMQQLADLAHQAALSQQLGPEGLLRWMVTQLDEQTRTADEDGDMRLCSDEDAVQLMTIFKSKGLEFPIVFVPTMWRRSTGSKGGSQESMLVYHDDAGRLVLNLDKNDCEGKQRQNHEKLEENIRLAYVALTRAAGMTYLVVTNRGEADQYALNHLWDKLCKDKAAHIEVDDELDGDEPPAVSDQAYCLEQAPPIPEKLMALAGANVDKTHGKASFSSLAGGHEAGLSASGSAQNRDEEDNEGSEQDDMRTVPSPAAVEPEWIFRITGGARTGSCWHDILEQLDFMADDPAITALVDSELDRSGVCRDTVERNEAAKRAAVQGMMRKVLAARLPAHGVEFALKDIPLAARRSELGFDFALRQEGGQTALNALYAVLDKHWQPPARDEDFLEVLKGRQSKLPLGYMNGFIDLVFMHKGRFYIVDWKSNRLDGVVANFATAGLKREMTRHLYYLQYMIYAVALNAFLLQRLNNYSFEKHFGGVFYFFLRGVDESGRGVFHDPLSRDLVEGISRELGAGR